MGFKSFCILDYKFRAFESIQIIMNLCGGKVYPMLS